MRFRHSSASNPFTPVVNHSRRYQDSIGTEGSGWWFIRNADFLFLCLNTIAREGSFRFFDWLMTQLNSLKGRLYFMAGAAVQLSCVLRREDVRAYWLFDIPCYIYS